MIKLHDIARHLMENRPVHCEKDMDYKEGYIAALGQVNQIT